MIMMMCAVIKFVNRFGGWGIALKQTCVVDDAVGKFGVFVDFYV